MTKLSPRPVAVLLLLWLGFCASSCGHLARRGQGLQPEERLAQVDALLSQRQDPDQLEQALIVIDEALLDIGDDPRLLARLALAHHAQGYGHAGAEPPPVRLFEAGREVAWRCIYEDPAFAGVLTSTGGQINAEAAQRIGDDHGRCLLWLVANWTRWLSLRDPAGLAIDLQPLQVLADRAVELNTGHRRAQALGLAGLSRALAPPSMSPDLEQARGLMLRAVDQDPDNLSLRVDLAQYVYGAVDDRVSFRETLQAVLDIPVETGDRWTLENKRAHQRARELLEKAD